MDEKETSLRLLSTPFLPFGGVATRSFSTIVFPLLPFVAFSCIVLSDLEDNSEENDLCLLVCRNLISAEGGRQSSNAAKTWARQRS